MPFLLCFISVYLFGQVIWLEAKRLHEKGVIPLATVGLVVSILGTIGAAVGLL
jgi:hypothetical protein